MSIRTSRSSKRLIAAAVAVAVTASTFAISNNAGASDDPATDRLSGADRYETAAKIALAAADNGTLCDVVIANGNSFADGLAAAGLAYDRGAVILLTEATSIPTVTVDAIEEMAEDCARPVGVAIVGGTSVVSEGVFEALASHDDVDTVERFAGANRYATSLEVAKEINPSTIIVVTGQNFPDALAAGPLAYDEGAAIVLHDGTSPSAEILAFLTSPTSIVSSAIIVGGTSVVPASIATALQGAGMTVSRIAGADRFETAVAVAAELDWTDGVILANGRNFPDALAAAPLAWHEGAPILLVEANSIPAATAKWHVDNADTIADVWVVGGTSVVSAAVLAGAKAAASAVLPAATGATVAIENTQAVFTVTDGASSAVVTLSAVPGSAADGAAANGWSIVIAEDATATNIDITVNAASTTFNVKVKNLAELTATSLAAAWNSSAAGSLLVAAVQTVGSLADPFNSRTTDGESEMTFTVTFNRKIDTVVDASISAFPNSLGSSNALFDFDSAATTLATSGLSLSAVYTATVATEVVTPGIAVLKLAADAVTADGTAFTNEAASVTITAAS